MEIGDHLVSGGGFDHVSVVASSRLPKTLTNPLAFANRDGREPMRCMRLDVGNGSASDRLFDLTGDPAGPRLRPVRVD